MMPCQFVKTSHHKNGKVLKMSYIKKSYCFKNAKMRVFAGHIKKETATRQVAEAEGKPVIFVSPLKT